MIKDFYLFTNELPNWADAFQAITAIIGIPLTIYTLYKLMKKDKERESEIASLSMIALQLKEMLEFNEKRYLENKKPQIEINYKKDLVHFLNFNNLNPNSQITSFEKKVIGQEKAISMVSSVKDRGKEQYFSFSFIPPTEGKILEIEMVYVVEKKIKYEQKLSLWLFMNTVKISEGPIELQSF